MSEHREIGSRRLSEIETAINAIWCELFGLREIKPNDNFFEIGGDSLSMIEMLFRLDQELGADLDPGLLFEDPTFGGFVRLVENVCQN